MKELLEFILFLAAILLCFYLPGKYLVFKLKLKINFIENLFFPIVMGLILFTIIAYILAWLRLSVLLLPAMVILSGLALREKVHVFPPFQKLSKWPLLFVGFLSFIFSLCMVATGIYGDSVVFRGDDLWHLALINELKVHFPPDGPGLAGEALRGYHFFNDFVIAQISNMLHIAVPSLHFHFFPLLIAFLWGYGVYALMLRWSGKNAVALWAVFLTMFGGSFAFFLTIAGYTTFSFDSGLGMWQPAMYLYNTPSSISFILVITALFSLHQFLTTRENKWLVPIALSCGLAPMFKVYSGIVLLGGLVCVTALELLKKRVAILYALLGALVIVFSTYWIFAGGSGFLIFYPFWERDSILRTFTWFGWDEKIETYTRLHVMKGIITTTGAALFFLLIGNLGTRVIGLLLLPLLLKKKKKLPSLFAFTILSMLSISILIPLFFIQSGRVYEVVQLTMYYLFFAAMFASFGFAALFEKKWNTSLKVIVCISIILVTLPSAYASFRDLYELRQVSGHLSSPYFKSMQFLSTQGSYEDTVFELPPLSTPTSEKELQKWYKTTTPAIIAFANKRSYFNNQYNDFPGTTTAPRITLLQETLRNNQSKNTSSERIIKKLQDQHITYIYSPDPLPSFAKDKSVKKIFTNRAATIYQIR